MRKEGSQRIGLEAEGLIDLSPNEQALWGELAHISLHIQLSLRGLTCSCFNPYCCGWLFFISLIILLWKKWAWGNTDISPIGTRMTMYLFASILNWHTRTRTHTRTNSHSISSFLNYSLISPSLFLSPTFTVSLSKAFHLFQTLPTNLKRGSLISDSSIFLSLSLSLSLSQSHTFSPHPKLFSWQQTHNK